MRNKIIVLVIVIAVIVGGYLFSKNQPAPADEQAMMAEKADPMMKEDEMMPASSADDKGKEVMMEDGQMMKYQGTVLAGASAPLLDYNQLDYKAALESDKLIVVYFYANWCPICRAEFPKMQEAFNELKTDDVVGFRMNYNDNDTDDQEQFYAREYGVAYQHTKVFIKNGERVLKSPETWDKDRYLSEINKALQ